MVVRREKTRLGAGRFVLDTNFILEYLKGVPDPVRFLEKRDRAELWISDITRLELLSFPSLGETEKARINDFLEHVEVQPLIEPIGDIAIAFRKATRRKLPDSIIAATAIHLEAMLVTSDRELLVSSFKGLSVRAPGLQLGYAGRGAEL